LSQQTEIQNAIEPKKLVKLYNVPRNSKVRYIHENMEYLIDFKHIDGMYSLSYLDGKPIHLAAWEEVEIVNE
jgi:hypothetical protein